MTAGGNAETMTGGVNMNLCRRTAATASPAASRTPSRPSSWQGDNLTRRAAAPSTSAPSTRSSNFYELNVEQGGPILQEQAVVLRRLPHAPLRQADRQHLRPADRTCPARRRSPRAWPTPAAASRASRPRRWTTRSSASPGRRRSATSSRSTWTARCACAATRWATPPTRAPRRWSGTRRPSPPARPSGPRRCRRSCCSNRLLVQPRALRQPLSARHPRRARHARRGTATCARTTSARASCGTPRRRSSATIPTATTSQARAVVRHRLAHRQGRRPLPVRASTAATTTPTPTSTRPTTTASPLQVTVLNTPLEVQENMDAKFGGLRAGLVALRQLHVQLRPALRPHRAEHRRPGGAGRPLRQRAGLRRLRGADVERLLAAHLGRLGHLRQRQDRHPRRLQQVHDGADHRLRAALQPDRADHRRRCRGPTSTATTSPRASAAAPICTAGCEINFANLPANFGIRALSTARSGHQAPVLSYAFNLGVTQRGARPA